VLTNRLSKILQRLVASNQSAFLKGRYILESVVTAHEVVHSVHSSKKAGLVLKLDYEKAFDKVDLDFMADLLKKRGFGSKWLLWMQQLTHNDSVGVKLNNVESDFFLTGKGLRQGDPISPLLFNLVVDVFTKMLVKAAGHNLIAGLCPEVCPSGIICLQYADDTILFLDNNISQAKNLKTVLTCFKQVSGMRINYSKSELIPMNIEDGDFQEFLSILECSGGVSLLNTWAFPSTMTS
jgi:hypothetical protein